MGKKVFFSVIAGALLVLGIEGACLAGIEPSPFQPEINKLHSIELQAAAINKRVAKVNGFETLPDGATNYLNAMANQMESLKTRLEEVLYVLDPPSLINPYIGQDEVVFALDSIKADSKGTLDIMRKQLSAAWALSPCPFLPLFRDISLRIIDKIDIHILPIFPPPPLP